MSKKSSTFALAFEKEATGSSSARLECLLWEQEVVSSNLAYPTNQRAKAQKISHNRKYWLENVSENVSANTHIFVLSNLQNPKNEGLEGT